MIQCPDCRSLIPDDSDFCDQCGKELKWCPECKRPKRGTQCPVCGSDLIPGRKYFSGGTPEETAAPDSSVSPQPVALVGNGWRLLLQPGAFGRLGGIWPELGTCQYVSGNHGDIRKGLDGWEITDAGSTNGTFVNGQRLATGSGAVLKSGDRVRIATLDFVVE